VPHNPPRFPASTLGGSPISLPRCRWLDASDGGRRRLLYVGISPSRAGRHETLRSRIRYHFRGNAEGSTLRLTLGCLLEPILGTRLGRVLGRPEPDFVADRPIFGGGHRRIVLVCGLDGLRVHRRVIQYRRRRGQRKIAYSARVAGSCPASTAGEPGPFRTGK
jgi:hypothetical protein